MLRSTHDINKVKNKIKALNKDDRKRHKGFKRGENQGNKLNR